MEIKKVRNSWKVDGKSVNHYEMFCIWQDAMFVQSGRAKIQTKEFTPAIVAEYLEWKRQGGYNFTK